MDITRNVQENSKSKQYMDKMTYKKSLFFHIFKRIVDIFFSTIGLVVLLPIFFIVGLLIKVEEPKGPIFFTQKRVGKDGNSFVMYKFRSMCIDAEEKLVDLMELNEIEGAMFKMKDDPRVTRIGKLIRRTSIDEMPQLLNVLKGNMSLVGPRPPLEREVIEYSDYDRQRLIVKPGCTGLWQISGRNNLGFKEMVELDLKYIKERSIKMDIGILLKTILVVLCLNNSNGH